MWILKLDDTSKLPIGLRRPYFKDRNNSKILNKASITLVFEALNVYRLNNRIYCDNTEKCIGSIKRILTNNNLPNCKKVLTKQNETVKIVKKSLIEVKLMTLKELEMILILKTLKHTENNKSKAAKLLGISLRNLRMKCKTLGV